MQAKEWVAPLGKRWFVTTAQMAPPALPDEPGVRGWNYYGIRLTHTHTHAHTHTQTNTHLHTE